MTSRLHRRLLASQYLRNNVLLFAAAMLVGFGNYLMHPLMLRLLGVENYGAVISILTLTGVLTIPVPVITIVVTRYASTLSAEGNLAQLNGLVRRLMTIMVPAGACVPHSPSLPTWTQTTASVRTASGAVARTVNSPARGNVLPKESLDDEIHLDLTVGSGTAARPLPGYRPNGNGQGGVDLGELATPRREPARTT